MPLPPKALRTFRPRTLLAMQGRLDDIPLAAPKRPNDILPLWQVKEIHEVGFVHILLINTASQNFHVAALEDRGREFIANHVLQDCCEFERQSIGNFAVMTLQQFFGGVTDMEECEAIAYEFAKVVGEDFIEVQQCCFRDNIGSGESWCVNRGCIFRRAAIRTILGVDFISFAERS